MYLVVPSNVKGTVDPFAIFLSNFSVVPYLTLTGPAKNDLFDNKYKSSTNEILEFMVTHDTTMASGVDARARCICWGDFPLGSGL